MSADYRREDDERLARIEEKLDDLLKDMENRVTKLEVNARLAGIVAGLVATFISSVLLLFVTAWMKR